MNFRDVPRSATSYSQWVCEQCWASALTWSSGHCINVCVLVCYCADARWLVFSKRAWLRRRGHRVDVAADAERQVASASNVTHNYVLVLSVEGVDYKVECAHQGLKNVKRKTDKRSHGRDKQAIARIANLQV